MKSWDEVRDGMVVYIKDPIEVYEDETVIGNTNPFQKAEINKCDDESVEVIIDGGQFDGYDFYWYIKRDKPEELLTKEEYDLFKITEKKIWSEFQKYVKKIDALKEKSDDILEVKRLIEKNQ